MHDDVRLFFESYRDAFTRLDAEATGFVAAEFEPQAFIDQPPDHAVADVRWTVHRQDGGPAGRFRTGYNLRRQVGHWRILLCTAYEEDRSDGGG